MNAASVQAQLYAIRAQVDALLLAVAEDASATAPHDECPHPRSQRRDLSVIGGPERWQCQLCGHEEVVSGD